MPLRTACSSCGKKLQVRDELAGKKVKCPDCGKVFIAASGAASGAPGAAEDAAAIKTSPSKPAPSRPSPPPVTKDKVAAKPMAKRPATPPVDDEDDEDVDERPTRRGTPARSGTSPVIWIALAAVLVLGGAGAAYYFFFMGPPANVGPIAKKSGPPVVPIEQKEEKTGQVEEKPNPVEENKTPVENPAPAGSSNLASLVPGDALFFATASGDFFRNKAFAAMGAALGAKVDDTFQKATGLDLGDLERVSMFSLAGFAESSKSKEPPIAIVVQTIKPINQKSVALAIKQLMTGKGPAMTAQFPNQQTILIGTSAHLVMYHQKKGKTKATGVLERALNQAATSKGAIVAVVVPPEAEQLGSMAIKDAPPFLAPLAPFLKTKSVLATVDISDKLKLQATLFMEDATAASESKTAAEGLIGFAGVMLGQLGKDPQSAALAKTAQQALKDLKISTQDTELAIAFETDMKAVMDAVMTGLMAAKGAAAAAGDTNSFKQIALGWVIYHDVHKTYPPQSVGAGLSWRVAILPYLEQDQLYKQFKMNEPWDSAHNKKLIPLMPAIYASPNAKPGFTFIQTFVGKKTINPDPKTGAVMFKIRDGTSNTLIFAEAGKAVEWTKPDDITVKDGEPIVLGGGNPKFTLAAKADASVLTLPRDIDQKTLRLLIDPADGMPIPNFDGPGPKQAPPMFKAPQKSPLPKTSEDTKPQASGAKEPQAAPVLRSNHVPADKERRLTAVSRTPYVARLEDEVPAGN